MKKFLANFTATEIAKLAEDKDEEVVFANSTAMGDCEAS